MAHRDLLADGTLVPVQRQPGHPHRLARDGVPDEEVDCTAAGVVELAGVEEEDVAMARV